MLTVEAINLGGYFKPQTNHSGFGFQVFEDDIVNSINAFRNVGVSYVLIDLVNNGGWFLHQYLAGEKSGHL